MNTHNEFNNLKIDNKIIVRSLDLRNALSKYQLLTYFRTNQSLQKKFFVRLQGTAFHFTTKGSIKGNSVFKKTNSLQKRKAKSNLKELHQRNARTKDKIPVLTISPFALNGTMYKTPPRITKYNFKMRKPFIKIQYGLKPPQMNNITTNNNFKINKKQLLERNNRRLSVQTCRPKKCEATWLKVPRVTVVKDCSLNLALDNDEFGAWKMNNSSESFKDLEYT